MESGESAVVFRAEVVFQLDIVFYFQTSFTSQRFYMVCKFMIQNLTDPFFEGGFGEASADLFERAIIDVDEPSHGTADNVLSHDIQVIPDSIRTHLRLRKQQYAAIEFPVKFLGQLIGNIVKNSFEPVYIDHRIFPFRGV